MTFRTIVGTLSKPTNTKTNHITLENSDGAWSTATGVPEEIIKKEEEEMDVEVVNPQILNVLLLMYFGSSGERIMRITKTRCERDPNISHNLIILLPTAGIG